MYLTFGEIMMRIIPEGFLRFRQALPGRVEAMFAGGEANVCASLAMFGCETRYLTAIPDNAITQSLLAALKGLGIDTSGILMRKEGRLGIYFLEQNREARSQKPEARGQESEVGGCPFGMKCRNGIGICPCIEMKIVLGASPTLHSPYPFRRCEKIVAALFMGARECAQMPLKAAQA